MSTLQWIFIIVFLSAIVSISVFFHSACRELVRSGELEEEPDMLISKWKAMGLVERIIKSKSKSRSVVVFKQLFFAYVVIGAALLAMAFMPGILRYLN
ncbi:MAG: hypothetical protein NTW74_21925 [Acidobacteria bacterium]|nr:hypothetical protein [Acidobacteriota bacterium]